MVEKRLAGGRQPHAAGVAREQRLPELVLEMRDLCAERRLRDANIERRGREAPMARDRGEIFELA